MAQKEKGRRERHNKVKGKRRGRKINVWRSYLQSLPPVPSVKGRIPPQRASFKEEGEVEEEAPKEDG